MAEIAHIYRETLFGAPIERVFDAFGSTAGLEQWFVQRAEIDFEPDGRWRFDWPGGMAAEGRVLEYDRPHRFVWTWEKSIGLTGDGGTFEMPSMVTSTYTFEEVDGGTRFTLEESGHDSVEIRDMNEQGVEDMLGRFRSYVEHGETVDWDTVPMDIPTQE